MKDQENVDKDVIAFREEEAKRKGEKDERNKKHLDHVIR